MLSENIKEFRKMKGYSQEMLAQQLNVVRQTVSKWEKGLSVPDADMLERMAEVFDISAMDLLSGQQTQRLTDSDATEIAKQLAILNEQFDSQIRRRKERTKKILIWIGAVIFFFMLINYCSSITHMNEAMKNHNRAVFECELNGEIYEYSVTYNNQGEIMRHGGDVWIAENVTRDVYGVHADAMIDHIRNYFEDRGGSCVITYETPMSK